jgi:organic radical activating enzyme
MNFSTIPFQNITKFGQQTMLDRPLFNTSWILGRFCNYKCSYCWPYANSSTPDHQPLEVYKSTVDEIKRQAQDNGFNQFHWSFSGGEPTAYKHLLELVEYLGSEEYQSIHMTTNLSPSNNWWQKWADNTKTLQRRSLTASYHAEFANEIEFADKILQLMADGVFVTINQVMVPDQFYSLYERLQRFVNKGINVTLKPQSNDTASAVVDGYSPRMIELMQEGFPQRTNGEDVYQIKLNDGSNNYYIDQAERFNAFGFNKFQGWSCNSGYQGVIIRGNEVKRGYSCHDRSLGTLDNFELFKETVCCITPTCVSSADSKIPKCKN